MVKPTVGKEKSSWNGKIFFFNWLLIEKVNKMVTKQDGALS